MAAPFPPALRQPSGSLGASSVPSPANLGAGASAGAGSLNILKALGPLAALLGSGGGGTPAPTPAPMQSQRQNLGPSMILDALGPGSFIRGSLSRR